MTLAHPLLGIVLGNTFGNFWFIFLGSIFPDIDHIILIAKSKIGWKKIRASYWFVNESNWPFHNKIEYKSKYVHSIFGAVVFSLPFVLFDFNGGLYFFIGYIIHLLLDVLTIEKSQYLYPYKKELKGFLPTPSKTEIFVALILIAIIVVEFKDSIIVVGVWTIFVLVLGTISIKTHKHHKKNPGYFKIFD